MVDMSVASHRALHSFDIRPHVKFEMQRAHENIILLLRAHPITLVPWILNTIFFFIILVGLTFLFPLFLNSVQSFFLTVFFFVIILSYIFFNFLSWFFNVGIITNERVIDIDFTNVIYREITDTQLSRIEDMTTRSGGFLESFFDFGDLFIQTAGTEQNIEFDNIPTPSEAVEVINNLINPT